MVFTFEISSVFKLDDFQNDKHARSPSPDVKSTAVVKYTAVKCPIGFARLQCNTDLKRPPSNWLSSATDSYGLRHTHAGGFSSFRLAHMFLDCVGEVDVVAGAECIKSLLKLPYDPTATVSIIVHRVENSLLLDQFDIHQNHMKSDWSWMKSFFYENFLKFISSEERVIYLKNKSRWALQQKSLVSKFLYHSLPSPKTNEMKEDYNKDLQLPTFPLPGPSLPEPDVQKAIPHPSFSDHTYNRNVVWTFEDIRMLIGSDMPIFGGVDRPCVSLRLQDASEPINVLTGIDYWLDNLMCNVPEVIMCYHTEGIVRKYEPIKTEELPNLQDSKFSPKVIRNVAQNILSFLKSNATKAGHTYWLYKGPNDDFIKLYDLSTLCGTTDNSPDQNPFTIPVAMLLYRVARNMKAPCQAGHMKMLLENCIKLLPEEKYPHIVASSHFMLANLYVPHDTNPESPNIKVPASSECECGDPNTCRRREGFEDEPSTEDMTYDEKIVLENKLEDKKFSNMVNNSKTKCDNPKKDSKKNNNLKKEELVSGDVAVHSLSAPHRQSLSMPTEPPLLICDKLEDRCFNAIKHVTHGLSSLKYFKILNKESNQKTNDSCADDKERILNEEDNPQMAKSFEPIPMGYESLNPDEECNMPESNTPIPMSDKLENESTIICTNEDIKSLNGGRSSRRRKRDAKNKKKAISAANTKKLENLRNRIDAITLRKDAPMPTWQEPSTADDDTWKIHIKSLLYRNACLACATLAELYYKDCQYGLALKYIRIAQYCQRILLIISGSGGGIDNTCILGRAGDIYFQFSKQWSKVASTYTTQYNSISKDEEHILEEIGKDIEFFGNNIANHKNDLYYDVTLPSKWEKSIIASEECYNKALKIVKPDCRIDILRRIASIKNEIGAMYMFNAQEHYTVFYNIPKDAENEKERKSLKDSYESFSSKTFSYFMEATKIFEDIEDIPNLALLHCNTGRYMRFRAHCNVATHSPEQRENYNKAINHYQYAVSLLEREKNSNILDLILWELSTATFTRACLLQDCPSKSPGAFEEAAEALKFALSHCPLTESSKLCLFQFRAGLLLHRLGSLYHNRIRESALDGAKLKETMETCKNYYSQASKLFLLLEDTSMFLEVQLEHVGLIEFRNYSTSAIKLIIYQVVFDLLMDCVPALKIISEREGSDTESKDDGTLDSIVNGLNHDEDNKNCENTDKCDNCCNDNPNKEMRMLTLLETRVQVILKHILQFCLVKSDAWKKDNNVMITYYKTSYGIFLKQKKFDLKEGKAFAADLYNKFLEVKKYPKK